MSNTERFDMKVDKHGPLWNGSHCWMWLAGTSREGYGRFWLALEKKDIQAHRHSYILHFGPIPDGLELDHLCRVPKCVNPNHLEAVTHRINILRGKGASAANARATHCPQGHPYDLVNTYYRPHYPTHRLCRACILIRNTKNNQARKQAKRHEIQAATAI